MPVNPRLNLARDFMENTGQSVFLTGKAGTGKTTFLKEFRALTGKRMMVVAPTGVAAINAGGVTLHSFFQLPFGVWLPGLQRPQGEVRRFSRQKIALIRSLDLLVIDEISMVRADLLDAVDEVLRRYRDARKPFGGVQLLMIGDMQQLAPVVRDDEWTLLRNHYASPYFFDSATLRSTPYACIELQHIYRQSDTGFIEMLAQVRDGRVSRQVIEALNARYRPGFDPPQSEGYITLCTHNHTARGINDEKLAQLPGRGYEFDADVEGDFPEYAYPVESVLRLKLGAQVMFCKNDHRPERRYVNGTIGTVTAIGDDHIRVTPADGEEIEVEKDQWENLKYSVDTATGQITESVEGVYTQYPLRTAWAITIHKSQGLTFERAIIDAGASFSHGQVYVALSRCRTLEGVVLRSPLSAGVIFSDPVIDTFSRRAGELHPTEEQLDARKQEYYRALCVELFDFGPLHGAFSALGHYAEEHLGRLYPKLVESLKAEVQALHGQIVEVGSRFGQQIDRLMGPGYATDPVLRERVVKACAYFLEKCDPLPGLLAQAAGCSIDNKETKKGLEERLDRARKEVAVKIETLKACGDGFSVAAYLKARGEAVAQGESSAGAKLKTKPDAKPTSGAGDPPPDLSADILNPVLFEILRQWRGALAAEKGVPAYVIATQKAITGISNLLPVTPDELAAVKGVGKVFMGTYGETVLAIVRDFMNGKEG
ncbi:MAG: AAA family ATPase [Rikenellaceae bacterium]|jgi:hypothetical protein|nr:AAA family ATPase [Rikenellaceae bacterium]